MVADSRKGKPEYAYQQKVMGFGLISKELSFTYSADSLARYQRLRNHYIVEIRPNSGIGVFNLIINLIFIGLGICILWNFRKMFLETDLNNPFTPIVVQRLRTLALLFIIYDVFNMIEYLLFNRLLNRSVSLPHFELITTVGSGILTGMVIWILAVIFQRGISLQEEIALTV